MISSFNAVGPGRINLGNLIAELSSHLVDQGGVVKRSLSIATRRLCLPVTIGLQT